jgi:predicted glycosyltransferase involved in capsule biosynthesis
MKNYRLYISNNKSYEFDNYEEFKRLIRMKRYKLLIDDKSYDFNNYEEFRRLFNKITINIRKYKGFVLHFYADKNESNIEYKRMWEILNNNKNKILLYRILI